MGSWGPPGPTNALINSLDLFHVRAFLVRPYWLSAFLILGYGLVIILWLDWTVIYDIYFGA